MTHSFPAPTIWLQYFRLVTFCSVNKTGPQSLLNTFECLIARLNAIIALNLPNLRNNCEKCVSYHKPTFLFLFQGATAFKTTNVSGQRCLAIAYDVAVTFLKQEIEGQFILNELKKLPNVTKSRLHFLSPDSEASYFNIAKGKDVYGKSVFKQCVSIPLSNVPGELLRAVQGHFTIILRCVLEMTLSLL